MDTYNKSESIWNKNFTLLFISRLVKLSGDGFAFNSILWFLIFDGKARSARPCSLRSRSFRRRCWRRLPGLYEATYAEILDVFLRPDARGGRVDHSGLLL